MRLCCARRWLVGRRCRGARTRCILGENTRFVRDIVSFMSRYFLRIVRIRPVHGIDKMRTAEWKTNLCPFVARLLPATLDVQREH